MELKKAAPADIPALTGISDAALRADATAPQRREPLYEGFDSEVWYAEVLHDGALFAWCDGDRIVGGAVAFFQNARLYIERFFARTDLERRALLQALEMRFPGASRIELEAPEENGGLLALLRECGYTPARGNGDWIYCLKMPGKKIPASEFLHLSEFDGRNVRVITLTGETFLGECSYNPEGYNDAELGIPEDGLQIDDTVVGRSDIARVEVIEG